MEGGRHAERDESERGRSCHRQATLVSATGLPTGARPARASLTDAACARPHGQPWAAVCRRAQGRGREQAGSRAPRHWHRRMTPPPGALPGPPSRRTRPPARRGVAAAVSDLRPAGRRARGRGRTRRTARANSSSARTRAHACTHAARGAGDARWRRRRRRERSCRLMKVGTASSRPNIGTKVD